MHNIYGNQIQSPLFFIIKFSIVIFFFGILAIQAINIQLAIIVINMLLFTTIIEPFNLLLIILIINITRIIMFKAICLIITLKIIAFYIIVKGIIVGSCVIPFNYMKIISLSPHQFLKKVEY